MTPMLFVLLSGKQKPFDGPATTTAPFFFQKQTRQPLNQERGLINNSDGMRRHAVFSLHRKNKLKVNQRQESKRGKEKKNQVIYPQR